MSLRSRRDATKVARENKAKAAIRVAFLVKVLAFDSKTMTVDVQPLNKELIDGDYVSAAPLMGLTVACVSSGDFFLRPWYKRGDLGLVVVTDNDSNIILEYGEESEPNTTRNHAVEDGIFIGGIFAKAKAPKTLPDNAFVIAHKDKYISLSESGITIQGDVQINGTLTATEIDS